MDIPAMALPVRYRLSAPGSLAGAGPLVAAALTGAFVDDSAGAPVIIDLRGLPETARTAVHRPTVMNDFGIGRGTVIYLNTDAPAPESVITLYELPRTGSSSVPAGADLVLNVATSYLNGAPDHVSASLSGTSGSGVGWVSRTQRISKNSGGSVFESNAFLAAALPSGTTIGAGSTFNSAVEAYTARDQYGYQARGDFLQPGSSGYAGFKFNRNGQSHYAFLFVRIGSALEVTVDYLGWESLPGTPITTQAPATPAQPPIPVIDVNLTNTGTINLSWDEIVGRTYTVQESINGQAWGPASGQSTKTGTRRTFTAAAIVGASKFYRVAVQ